jgi:hypothetical protein
MDLAQIACSQGHFAEGRTRYRESIALWKEGGNRKGLALTLAVFANCLVKEVEGTQNFRQAAQAAQLMGAAQALRMSVGSPASEDAVYENEAATLRAFLGQAEFDTAFQTGQTLSWDQITAIIDSESSG